MLNYTDKESIITYNALIAKYDGLVYRTPMFQNKSFCAGWYDEDKKLISISDEGLNYHKDFNKLIKVVEKIEKGNYGFKMCRKTVEIYYDDTKDLILKVKESSRLESLYKALVEFILIKSKKEEVNYPFKKLINSCFMEIEKEFVLSLKDKKSEDAFELCQKYNVHYRVVSKDSKFYVITHDFVLDRINFVITNDIITNAYTG